MLGFFRVRTACAGHGVVTPLVPGVTFAQTPKSHNQSFVGSVAFESFYGVMGAGGLEATVVTQPGTQQILVTPYGYDQQSRTYAIYGVGALARLVMRFHKPVKREVSCCRGTISAPRRARTIASIAGSLCCSLRKVSRAIRLI